MLVFSLALSLSAATTLNCGTPFGTKFNLEPAANAVPQQFESVDFIPNRVALNEDLVVGGANDSRGVSFAAATATSAHWDGSLGGYYVRRSSKAGCAPQFEGGLPVLTAGGNSFTSNGGVVVAADAARDAFFVADLRFSLSASLSAVGLFRASSATLLNTTSCPNGTHTAAQALSCWGVTPPVVLDQVASGGINNALDYPSIAVDERPNGSGTGASDVYVAVQNFSNGINLMACTNSTLSCSAPIVASASSEAVGVLGTGNVQVQVRPDGNITLTYLDFTSPPAYTIQFVMCKPAGAPNPPTCSAPVTVANEAQGLFPPITNQTLSGLNMLVFTSTRHANRLEADGKTFTTFVVWDRCKTFFTFIQQFGAETCLDADVVMSSSTDGGNTWSAVAPVNAGPGHQFLPAISTDESTGTVNIGYYNTEPDVPHKRIEVSVSQIAAGSIKVGAPIPLTTVPAPWDADPTQGPLALDFFDFHFGIRARGMGSAGHSRVYASFTSTADRFGIYKAQSLREQNNNLQELIY
jgi:hypothetical protein